MSTPNSPTTVWVLNGVNLGRLGTRQPEVYGSTTYDELVQRCSKRGSELGLAVECRQTDSEAELVGWLHESADAGVPVILNPGAWSHYSLAVADAVALRTADLVEVHISNIHARETYRHHSVISAHATGVIAGLGLAGYDAALAFFAG